MGDHIGFISTERVGIQSSHSSKMANRNAKTSISTILRKNRGLRMGNNFMKLLKSLVIKLYRECIKRISLFQANSVSKL